MKSIETREQIWYDIDNIKGLGLVAKAMKPFITKESAQSQERYGDTMAGIISVEHINPFLLSAQQILSQVCNIQTKVGQISKDNMCIDGEPVFIMLGVTGEMTGQVCIVFDLEAAKDVASRMMMGMPVAEIDDMAKSALSELGNMIMGNAATLLSNNSIRIDITPPTLGMGSTKLTSPNLTSIMVPLVYEGGEVKLYFLLKLV